MFLLSKQPPMRGNSIDRYVIRTCINVINFVTLFFVTTMYSAASVATPAESNWARWIVGQVNEHPNVAAAKQALQASLHTAKGREQAIYNPELETEIEREGKYDNYRLGISQSVDWWDKRDVRKRQASFSRLAAKQSYQQTVQLKTAEVLRALIRWQATKDRATLARQQESQLDSLLVIIGQRQQTGDLGLIDTELTYLSLSEQLNATAVAMADFKKAEAQLRELLANWSVEQFASTALIPESLWTVVDTGDDELWLDSHPAVVGSKARWSELQQGSVLARRESKADPRLGINAGQSGQEDVVALTFSIPLNIRNNYSAVVRAANAKALAAEATFYAVRRKQQAAIEAAGDTLLAYQQQYRRWENIMAGRGERSLQLLDKQWRNNDMSTTQYLLASQQRNQGLLAGIELRQQFQAARVDWLLQTGSINAALIQLSQ